MTGARTTLFGPPSPRTRVGVSLLAVLLLAPSGCASVPDASPVQVLRQVGGDEAAPPPGPVDGSNPLDLVRDFVTASGSSTDKHAAARAFLAPEAAKWDDATGATVLDGQIDTVPVPGAADSSTGATIIRVRGTQIGRLTQTGSFEPAQSPFQWDVDVVRRDGQWRISRLPDGVVVPLSIFRDDFRTVRAWFVDPTRQVAVGDLRYVPSVPAKAQAARVIDQLLAGPSSGLSGGAVSELVPGARLRSNVAATPDGAVVVDLTRTGDLDATARRLLAAQVVLSLAEVNVGRVRLLVDGEPLVADHSDWTRDDFAAIVGDAAPGADVPALVVAGGRVAQLSGTTPTAPLPGPVGNGAVNAESAASTVDGLHLAVVARAPAGRTLLIGGSTGGAGVTPVALTGATMSRPSWTPTGSEVWTVLNGDAVARVTLDTGGGPRVGQVNADALTVLGPIADLRLSRDGMRVVAVVAGGLYAGAVARSIDGEVAIRDVRRLRSADITEAVAADWRSSDTIVAITAGIDAVVAQVSVDGLTLSPVLGNNLTPPLTAVAAAPNRPLLVADQGGVWSFAGDGQDAWRQVLGGASNAVPVYPG
ncbi:MAG: GerMN domain-containing protein [Pseudonocardiales bacterium]|nr:GerMN domain-containing protein [Pseudonocardiales bacterium]